MNRQQQRIPATSFAIAMAFTGACVLVTAPQAARASITFGAPGDRTACPDATFNACYIGVDGSRVATVDANSSSTFSFVGLGVQSSELGGVTFPGMAPTGATAPNGNLTVAAGASLQVSGSVNPARPYDAAIVVGLGNGSTGTLLVAGGQVTTPVLAIGQYDGVRMSSGQVTLANDNGATNNFASRIVVTADGSVNGSLPGFTAIQIGRGLGSAGDLSIGYGDTVVATAGSVSIGRAGTGSLEIANNASLSTAGSVYASAADPHGTSTISVAGALNLGVGGRLLLGIAVDPASGGLDQTYLTSTQAGGDQHGSAVLTLLDGTVNGGVVIGKGSRIQGNGTINGDVYADHAYVSPGFSPGKIAVDGDFVMDGGTYLVQIAGTGAGMTDFLDITGSATLTSATILFSFIDGFAPSAGFTFDFLHAANGLSTANLTFLEEGLLPGFTFDTSSNGGAFTFRATSNGTAVPEPAPFALLAIGLVGAVLTRRRRAQASR